MPTARKPGQRFGVFFLSFSQCYGMDCYTTRGVVGWGRVGCNDILELAHMVDATVNLCTWLMLRNMMGWGGWGMMLTFLELAYMVDATQHDGVGWVGNDVNVP